MSHIVTVETEIRDAARAQLGLPASRASQANSRDRAALQRRGYRLLRAAAGLAISGCLRHGKWPHRNSTISKAGGVRSANWTGCCRRTPANEPSSKPAATDTP